MRPSVLKVLLTVTLALHVGGIWSQTDPSKPVSRAIALTRSEEVVPPTIADLVLLLESYAPDLARIERLRAEVNKHLPQTEDLVDLTRAWHQKARAARELGQVSVWFAALKQALTYAERAPTSGARDDLGDLMRIRQDMVHASRGATSTGESIDVTENFIKTYRATRAGPVIGPLGHQANNYLTTGNVNKVKSIIADMEGVIQVAASGRNSSLWVPGWNNSLEIARGRWFMAQGKFEAAEQTFQLALRHAESNSDADLVVLSACNTAAADGSGSEAVSGLGRAFFYAGSRSVLATHWPVESVSARQLVTELFERYANEGGLTRAKALQQAMLTLMDKGMDRDAKNQPNFSYAHPAFWAPYALYGDPGR